MKVITPINLIADATISGLTAGTTYSAYNSGTTYNTNDKVKYNGAYYNFISASPTAGATPEGANIGVYWELMYYANEYAMFDGIVENQTEETDEIDVTIELPASARVTSLSLLNIDAETLKIYVGSTDPSVSYAYSDSTELVSNGHFTSNYDGWTSENSAQLIIEFGGLTVRNPTTNYGRAVGDTIGAIPGAQYNFSGDVTGYDGGATVSSFWLGTSADIDHYGGNHNIVTGTYTYSFVADDITLVPRLLVGGNTSGAKKMFDNISITADYAYYASVDLEDTSLQTTYGGVTLNSGVYRNNYHFFDLPGYNNCAIRIVLSKASGTVKCGNVVIGYENDLATTLYGTGVDFQNYDTKSQNEYATLASLTSRQFENQVNYRLLVPKENMRKLTRIVDSLRRVPTIWIGKTDREETVIYGYADGISVAFDAPSYYGATLRVKEMRIASVGEVAQGTFQSNGDGGGTPV